MKNNQKTEDRVSGLDSIRFIAAMVVFFGHGAEPPLSSALAHKGILDNFWFGPAAVIVFFVVSGFCIHYPFAGNTRQPRLAEFYARRFIRLCLPAAVAIPLSQVFGYDLALFHASILWSLGAELFYYLIYPALRKIQLSVNSWTPIIIVAYVLGAAVALTKPRAIPYPSFGVFTCILGLPCWVLGCAVAEYVRCKSLPVVSVREIWAWRASVFFGMWTCRTIRFHLLIGCPWSLNVFALLAAAWLIREISFQKSRPAPRLLESAGAWSYSLYLLHPAFIFLFEQRFPNIGNAWLRWAILCSFVLGACYCFYLLIERPSHALARNVARKFRAAPPEPGPAAPAPAVAVQEWKIKAPAQV
jgi:peptidoglycan/LPS O-acetylase OafA/YrhL